MENHLKLFDTDAYNSYNSYNLDLLDSSFEHLFRIIKNYHIRLGREEARAVTESPVNTQGLVIHTENEIEENDGRTN